jgi:hypothetical protein
MECDFLNSLGTLLSTSVLVDAWDLPVGGLEDAATTGAALTQSVNAIN